MIRLTIAALLVAGSAHAALQTSTRPAPRPAGFTVSGNASSGTTRTTLQGFLSKTWFSIPAAHKEADRLRGKGWTPSFTKTRWNQEKGAYETKVYRRRVKPGGISPGEFDINAPERPVGMSLNFGYE